MAEGNPAVPLTVSSKPSLRSLKPLGGDPGLVCGGIGVIRFCLARRTHCHRRRITEGPRTGQVTVTQALSQPVMELAHSVAQVVTTSEFLCTTADLTALAG